MASLATNTCQRVSPSLMAKMIEYYALCFYGTHLQLANKRDCGCIIIPYIPVKTLPFSLSDFAKTAAVAFASLCWPVSARGVDQR